MNFGLGLQPVIDLIEVNNSIGILPCLDEDFVMPKAVDKTFGVKLNAIWNKKSPNYEAHRFNEGFFYQALHCKGRLQY